MLQEGQQQCKMHLTHPSMCAIWGERELISRKSRAAMCHRITRKKQQSSYGGICKIKYRGLLFILDWKKQEKNGSKSHLKHYQNVALEPQQAHSGSSAAFILIV